MRSKSILIVDDEKNIRRSVELICGSEGYTVLSAPDGAVALETLATHRIDLVLLDINLPGTDGLTLLKQIREQYAGLLVIIISGHATIENAVAATKSGAYDFIEKPILKEKLLLSIKNALQSRSLQQENIALRRKIEGRFEMVGESEAMRSILAQIEKVAPTDGRVLILGESGTGKELIARAIHENSQRRHGPFVKVNCAAIPEELIESELFGSVKGAYTGAIEDREGKFKSADGGTLFLDEVGDMSLKVQAKVLRALQEGEIEKVGGRQVEKVDVRVVAATNKNLDAEVQAGRFREDLYFRLNVIPIVSAALRQRREDIPRLAAHFIDQFCDENGFRKIRLTENAMQQLCAYDWPGNIRELKNIIERLIIMSGEAAVDAADLPPHIHAGPAKAPGSFSPGMTLKQVKEQVEKEFILETLNRHNWNISQTARVLGIDRTNLHKKLNYYGLSGK